METAGAYLRWYDITPQLNDDWVLGLGEMMNYRGVLDMEEEVLNKLRSFAGAIRDGHAPGMTGHDLIAYAAAGIGSDHEATTVAEMQERLRLGMYVFIREASNAPNLDCRPHGEQQPTHLLLHRRSPTRRLAFRGTHRLPDPQSCFRGRRSDNGHPHGHTESSRILSPA
jgi:hypothetical protein